MGANYEYMHMNSFYEIPPNRSKHPAFKAGNYIVNSVLPHAIFVFDRELKKILWTKRFPGGDDKVFLHDVQVEPSGKLLIYSNRGPLNNFLHSTIEEYDPVTDSARVLYRGNPPSDFDAPTAGGVQRLSNGQLLIFHRTKGCEAAVINRAGQVIKRIPVDPISKNPGYNCYQQINAYDLSSFLKNHKGL